MCDLRKARTTRRGLHDTCAGTHRHPAHDARRRPHAGTWDDITSLFLHTGQPFADTSIFGVNAVCREMRRHVAVALSGDGGDEAFGGYDTFWQLGRIFGSSSCREAWWPPVSAMLRPLEALGVISRRLAQRIEEFRESR